MIRIKVANVFFILSIMFIATAGIISTTLQDASGMIMLRELEKAKAPIVSSDGNVYVTWWTNKTGNNEVMFRASNDAGLTFGDKINLSNTTDIESVDTEIAAEGENVYVTWWERNENVHPHTNEPVARISNDGGQTFGPVLQLSQNGTLGTSPEERE